MRWNKWYTAENNPIFDNNAIPMRRYIEVLLEISVISVRVMSHELHGVSCRRKIDCLFNSLFNPITKKSCKARRIHEGWQALAMTWKTFHYSDVIMSAMTSQIIGVSIVYPTVCSGADQRKHQSSASLAYSQHKGPVTRKRFPFDDFLMFMWNILIKFQGHFVTLRSIADCLTLLQIHVTKTCLS